MGFMHQFLRLGSGRLGTGERKNTVTTTLCKVSKDNYEIANQCMGEGTFAKVHLATRHRDGQVFALKIFRRNAVDSRMVQAEFYIAQALRHKNIIATYALCTLESTLGLLMEYAPNSLFDLVTSSELRPGDSEKYLADLVGGVEHIHRLGFAHRDLKLENIVIGVNGNAKVIDFGTIGVAKPSPTGKFIDASNLDMNTDSYSANIGSPPYMAPELFTHSRYDPTKADVWSLGIVYACMVLGKFPWTAAHKQNAQFAAYSGVDLKLPVLDLCPQSDTSFQNPSVFIRQFPANTQSVVHSMLRVQPAKRSKLAAIGKSISLIQNQQGVSQALPKKSGISL